MMVTDLLFSSVRTLEILTEPTHETRMFQMIEYVSHYKTCSSNPASVLLQKSALFLNNQTYQCSA